ncbi:hypothetical protein ACFSMW_06780 [Virgibacillus halophilus]|uniref:Uncharacterized protein n=1 Tax=Tigheibacillus halophilus TaxID=361280 RepID=A0ABU5C7C3_9BACI|nr:hypothetical protein [Virgibacillus halophilus]
MKATHKQRELIFGNQVITLEPGQFVTGRESLADDLNKGTKPKQRLSEKTWYRYIGNLEKWQMLTINKTNKYSVISICKWSEYQDSDQQMSISCPSDDHQMSTNKNVKNENNDKKNKDYTSKIKDLLPVFSSINNFNQLNKRYWDAIRETRKTGQVSKSVIYNTMKKWEKYNPVVIEYALKSHIDLHVGKKEEYTIGIMRNTSEEEAKSRMTIKDNTIPFKPKTKSRAESRYDNIDYGF